MYPLKRSRLDNEMNSLETSLLELASRVEKALKYAMSALKSRDHLQAQLVIANDRPINAHRYEVESDAMFLLALHQPVVSRDLRYIAAVMHIAGELERMGDYAKGIARISDSLSGELPLSVLLQLEEMAEQAGHMLRAAMDAFIDRNALAAEQVAAQDDVLDVLYDEVYKQLLALMFSNNSQIDLATALLWAAHNLERIGDRVTNICERIRFVETGIMGDQPGLHHDANN